MLPRLNKKIFPPRTTFSPQKIEYFEKAASKNNTSINEAFWLLKVRKDNAALVVFDKVLRVEPDNLDALWGKAEVKRRNRQYDAAEDMLNEILKKNPKHYSSLISLAYIRYKDGKLNEARKLISQVLVKDCHDRQDRALAYMMLGAINSSLSAKGWLFNKVKYGIQIKGCILKARTLAPDLPEVHLGLGTFYLLAPVIMGGNLNQALKELELAVKIAPDFATANARLAQAYKKKGNLEKYNFYIQRARELDPKNEVLVDEKFRD